jgi:hypothetical protein
MAIISSVVQGLGKSYEVGLGVNKTYFQAGATDLSLSTDDLATIPTVPENESLIFMGLKNPWLTTFQLTTKVGGTGVTNATNFNFNIYGLVSDTGTVNTKDYQILSDEANPLVTVTTGNWVAGTYNTSACYFHGKVFDTIIDFPNADIQAQYDAVTLYTIYDYALRLAIGSARTGATQGADIKADIANDLAGGARNKTFMAEIDQGGWGPYSYANKLARFNADMTTAITEVGNIVVTTNTKGVVVAALTVLRNAQDIAVARAYQKKLKYWFMNIQDPAKRGTVQLYLGIQVTAHDLPAEVRFILDYASNVGSSSGSL